MQCFRRLNFHSLTCGNPNAYYNHQCNQNKGNKNCYYETSTASMVLFPSHVFGTKANIRKKQYIKPLFSRSSCLLSVIGDPSIEFRKENRYSTLENGIVLQIRDGMNARILVKFMLIYNITLYPRYGNLFFQKKSRSPIPDSRSALQSRRLGGLICRCFRNAAPVSQNLPHNQQQHDHERQSAQKGQSDQKRRL